MKISELIAKLQVAESRYRDAEIHAYNKDGELSKVTDVDLMFTVRGSKEIERVFVTTEA